MEKIIFAQPIGYQLVEFLGEGLNSCVYRAIREAERYGVSQNYAIKILKSEKSVDLWRNEVERLSTVRSVHCVSFIGWEVIFDKPALILEYVNGVTLEEFCSEGRVSSAELKEILAQAMGGLNDLREARLFHGDLNFHNIMIDVTGVVKLVDFGVRGANGDMMMTPQFAAPAVLAGGTPDYHSDIYSLRAIGAEVAKKFGLPLIMDIEELVSTEASQCSLAQNVKKTLEFKARRRGLTKKVEGPRAENKSLAFSFRIFSFCFLCSLPFMSRGDQFFEQRKFSSTLSVRTREWTFIEVNGRPIGYAPVDILLAEPENVYIAWVSANGRGQTPLTLSQSQHIVLKDEFFKRASQESENAESTDGTVK